jgi:hypothetical protein
MLPLLYRRLSASVVFPESTCANSPITNLFVIISFAKSLFLSYNNYTVKEFFWKGINL